MAKTTPPDERVVYLALKNVFLGEEAKARQPKVIHKLVSKNKRNAEVANLVREYNFDTVCTVARTLLTEQVFESPLKAKLRFPEVFNVSPAQTAEREASEAEAARSEANAIRDAVQGHQDCGHDMIKPEAAADCDSVDTYVAKKDFRSKPSHSVSSLFPVYLPLPVQHLLLAKVQTILERACFEFGEQSMPGVLQKNQWDCPEAGELNIWVAEFQKRESVFQKRKDVGKPLMDLFRSVADIRHAAVHRIRVSGKGIEQFLLDAESLATLLEHQESLKVLPKLRQDTKIAIEELEHNKHVLSSKFEQTMKNIAAQRLELDRVERAAISDLSKEDGDYQKLAGMNLMRAIRPEEVVALSTANTEKGTSSEAEDTEDAENETEVGCAAWA